MTDPANSPTERTDPDAILARFSLNPEQRQAADWDGGHLLVLAGPGSGKTRTLIARAAWLIAAGVDPRRVLVLTFTRRAADELKSRLGRLLGTAAQRIQAGTFHHFALQSMRSYPDGFPIRDHVVIDQDDEETLIKGILAERPGAGRALPKADRIAGWYSYARNSQLPLPEYLKRFGDLSDDDRDVVLEVVRAYRERKKESRYLDFDDILLTFAKGLKDQDATRQRFLRRYDHILVDEMQDTNPLQWAILASLADPAKLFCVGDDAQSIYAFRGADFRNVHAFRERMPGSSVLHLDRNYRSTQPILDVANALLERSAIAYDKHLVAVRGAGALPELHDFASDIAEAEWISDRILADHQEGIAFADQLVLTRAAYLTRRLETALIERRIPYRLRGGRTFLQAAHVKDLLSMLRVAVNPIDELGWSRFLQAWPGIGQATAARVARRRIAGEPLAEAILGAGRSAEVRKSIVAAMDDVQGTLTNPTQSVAAARRHLEPLMQRAYDAWPRRREDLQFLEDLAGRYRSIDAFLDATAIDPVQLSQQLPGDEDVDVVTLSTVHAAKGTEAPNVYVCRAEPGVFPFARSEGDADAEEEERRILYVAITRAADRLMLTRVVRQQGRFLSRFAGSLPGLPDRTDFVGELPSELFDTHTTWDATDQDWDFDDDLL